MDPGESPPHNLPTAGYKATWYGHSGERKQRVSRRRDQDPGYLGVQGRSTRLQLHRTSIQSQVRSLDNVL